MGLTIEVLEDGGLRLSSDDADASNVRVGDCFGTDEDMLDEDADGFDIDRIVGADGTDYFQKWMSAPLVDDILSIEVPVEDTNDVLSALEREFPFEAEAAYETLKTRTS